MPNLEIFYGDLKFVRDHWALDLKACMGEDKDDSRSALSLFQPIFLFS